MTQHFLLHGHLHLYGQHAPDRPEFMKKDLLSYILTKWDEYIPWSDYLHYPGIQLQPSPRPGTVHLRSCVYDLVDFEGINIKTL